MKKLALFLLRAGILAAGCTYFPYVGNVCCVNGDAQPTDQFTCVVYADGYSYCYQQYECPPLVN